MIPGGTHEDLAVCPSTPRRDRDPLPSGRRTAFWYGAGVSDVVASGSDWKRYAEASIKLFDILLEEMRDEVIIDSLARIVGETLGVDRSLIYDVSYSKDHAHCLTEWLNPARPDVTPTRGTYPLSLFRGGAELVSSTRDRLESQAVAPHEALVRDGAASLLHDQMAIKSLLWYPFMFGDDGFYLFAFNHVDAPHAWSDAEVEFMRTATRHVNMALVKIRLIEERSRAERAAFGAQKLESLGLLAGGVAHDFNNLMVVVIANAELIERRLPTGSPLREPVRWIRDSGLRAAALAGQMLAYAGKGTPRVELVDPRLVVNQAVQLVRASFPDVSVAVTGDALAIACNRTQFEQVVMNLVVNAAEATVGRSGHLTVRFASVELDTSAGARWVPSPPQPGTYVELEVTDDGCGMESATVARIFDPFFSTKFEGRGLGLSAVQGIVRDHGGALRVTSQVGVGTTFTVLWPVRAAEPVAEPRVATVVPQHHRILVIDDEPSVATAITAVLEDRGFSCDVAVGGAAGIEAFRAYPASIDCVLLDLTMPAPSGRQVLEELRRAHPHLPVVLMSGYTENAHELAQLPGPTRFVSKPFTTDELLVAVNAAMTR
jgi:signal transduction histidine kinase